MPRLAAPRALAPLRHQGFRLLTIGQVTSNVGDACYAVALPWYVLAAHGGVLLLGTALAAYGCRGPRGSRWAGGPATGGGRKLPRFAGRRLPLRPEGQGFRRRFR